MSEDQPIVAIDFATKEPAVCVIGHLDHGRIAMIKTMRDATVHDIMTERSILYDGTPDIEAITSAPPIEKKQPKINPKTKAAMEKRFKIR